MKTHLAVPGLLLAAALFAPPAFAQITVDVVPALAPNVYGSPSMDAWTANAFTALYTGASTAGIAGTPGFYARAIGPLAVSDIVVTSFPSWLGRADPGAAFGSAFAAETGNRLHYGLIVNGHGQSFAIAQLGFSLTPSDPSNPLGLHYGPGAYTYSSAYTGIRFGADGQMGGGDDTFITSGPATQMVDAVIGRGSGNAFWPQHQPGDGLTDQQLLDQTIGGLTATSAFALTGSYSLTLDGGGTASGEATLGVIPEPSTYAAWLGTLTLASVAWRRWRQRTDFAG